MDEVELGESNPTYAHIRYPNGREDTVSLRDIAPCGKDQEVGIINEKLKTNDIADTPVMEQNTPISDNDNDDLVNDTNENDVTDMELRRSTRIRRAPQRLDL